MSPSQDTAPVPPEMAAPPGPRDTGNLDFEQLARQRQEADAQRLREDERDPVESAKTPEALETLTDRIVGALMDPESTVHDDRATAHELLSRIARKAQGEAARYRRLAEVRREEGHLVPANRYSMAQFRAEVHTANLAAQLAAERKPST